MTRPLEPVGRLQVHPPLNSDEVAFVAGFSREPLVRHDGNRAAEAAPRVRRLWPGRPHGWSPWVACVEGCCLVIRDGESVETAAAWLRFLVHTFLRPTARRARLARLGLTFQHSVEGRVWFETEQDRFYLVSVRGNRVHTDAVLMTAGESRER
ncbi:hypothetical protein [Nocardioides sp. LHG3406-4]|uniref:hypothetical protein n=1 Tax=Nocardioides sp. LHG3406-4 TaxID=2804575 RepID=UPI003CF5639A